MSRVVFLGPQRFRPTLAAVLDRLEVDGTVAAVTAGWQEREQEVDELHDRVFSDLIVAMIRDSSKIARATHLIYVTKYLERIGDHSCNMAEMVIFMVKGEDVRHMEKIRKLVEGRP